MASSSGTDALSSLTASTPLDSSHLFHRRSTTAKSSKVAASRERRARRTNKASNGHSSSGQQRHRGHDSSSSFQRLALLAFGIFVVCLLITWGGAVYKVTTSSSDKGAHPWPQMEARKPSSGLRRKQEAEDPYASEFLFANPWLGWQPPHAELSPDFSWRKCFEADPKSDGSNQPPECRESPFELGDPPPVPADWVPDVTMIRKMLLHGKDINDRPFPPPLSKELCQDIAVRGGRTGDTNKECLRAAGITTAPLTQTTVQIPNPQNPSLPATLVPAPKLMCLVYTMADAHATRIRAMRETWAGGCDGFLAFSTESDPRLPAISLDHDGPESYDNMWQKIRSIWRFAATHYLDDFEWFFIGGDDLFVLPHNLKKYLATLASSTNGDPKSNDYFVGRRFNAGGNDYFNSGGAGYALSQSTLRKFFAVMDDAQKCHAKAHTSMEDVMIAKCLRNLGISFTDTRDLDGRERFHPFAPGTHLHWAPPKEGAPSDWYEEYNREWGLKYGKDCCAPDSVSFHYVKKASMVRHMQALLYNCQGEP